MRASGVSQRNLRKASRAKGFGLEEGFQRHSLPGFLALLFSASPYTLTPFSPIIEPSPPNTAVGTPIGSPTGKGSLPWEGI